MQVRQILLSSLFVATGYIARAAPSSPDRVSEFLYAIRQVESGNRYDLPPGKYGELGAYQFRREVWLQHTHAPFTDARTPFADTVARLHYEWITEHLRKSGTPATPWNIAAAWNSGVVAVNSGRIPHRSRDYANRVVNLYREGAALRARLTPSLRIAIAANP